MHNSFVRQSEARKNPNKNQEIHKKSTDNTSGMINRVSVNSHNNLGELLQDVDITNRVNLIQELQLTQGNRCVQQSLGKLLPSQVPNDLHRIDRQFVQREDDEDLNLDLDWNRYQLNYKNANLGYQLGGELYSGVNLGDFAGQIGFNPGSNAVSLSGSYEDIAAKLGYNPTERNASLEGSYEGYRLNANVNDHGNFGVNLGYGLPMLPSTEALSEEMHSGGNAASNVFSDLPNFDNPYSFTRTHGGDFKSIGNAASTLVGVTRPPEEQEHNFGVELGVSYGPAEIDEKLQEFRIMGQLRLLLDELGGGE